MERSWHRHLDRRRRAAAVTLLSDNWNDVNSFAGSNAAGIYGMSLRNGTTTWYRTAIIAGKGVSFPQPAGTGQDYGTDGGHPVVPRRQHHRFHTLVIAGSIPVNSYACPPSVPVLVAGTLFFWNATNFQLGSLVGIARSAIP